MLQKKNYKKLKLYRLFKKVVATLNRNVATNRNVVTAKSGYWQPQ